jgi:His/Glu/Gln/Arg/opine family amino acid ABC transporter permease subunit
MDLDFSVIGQYASWIVTGVEMTIFISFVSMLLALIVGLFVALLRMSPIAPVRTLTSLYIQVFRGIPLLVFLIWLYFGFSFLTGINFTALEAGIICLSVQYAAFLAEIYRSGIQAIDKGQREAAASLGLSAIASFRYVVFPQALRIIVPPIGNMTVGMVKDSSLVSVVGVTDLMREAQIAVSQTFRPFEFYTVVAAIYISMTLGLAFLAGRLEKRMRVDFLRQPGMAGRLLAWRPVSTDIPDYVGRAGLPAGTIAPSNSTGSDVPEHAGRGKIAQ